MVDGSLLPEQLLSELIQIVTPVDPGVTAAAFIEDGVVPTKNFVQPENIALLESA